MFSGYYKPLDNIASVIPCSPEMSIRTTIADGLLTAVQSLENHHAFILW